MSLIRSVDMDDIVLGGELVVDDPFETQIEKHVQRILKLSPSQWVENFVQIKNADSGKVEKIDFKERRYLERPYNTPSERVLLFTSRQTEKCVALNTLISMADGRLVEAKDIRVGDLVATMRPDGTVREGRVLWVSERRKKPGVRIETRQGHVLEAATTHPVRSWESWKEAGALRVGDRLAAVRQCGTFGSRDIPAERIRLTAYLIGDGSIGGNVIGFTAVPGPVLQEFAADVSRLGGSYRTYKSAGRAVDVRLRRLDSLWEWLREDGLLGKKSASKFLPSWVFELSKEDTALFINRLWATDGHVSQRTATNYSIVYASMSRRMVEQLQALLWKFRVPSRIRENWPSIYKKRGERKFAYLLGVETQDGIARFLREIGALGKSEDVAPPKGLSNNNQDTLPLEVQGLLDEIVASATYDRRSTLYHLGLPRTLSYAPTHDTLCCYLHVFRQDPRYDQKLVDRLEGHLSSDLYWDRVKALTALENLECVDFEIEDTHNFIAAGLVTHNSTSLANKMLAQVGMRPYYSNLFVSPAAMQTKVFSTSRLDDIITISPMLKGLTHRSLIQNLLEKEFINGSKIYLRYAFLSADRIRGLSVNSLFVDEIQDIAQDLLPVIAETTSHHKDSRFCYSGTPKSLSNTIEFYWSKQSTQSEWVIPCEHHGLPNDPSTWYWVSQLGINNIGKTGLICDKCGHPLNPEHPLADWAQMRSGAQFEGFRICRLMVPWFFKDPKKWKEIIHARETYPVAQFYNEVLAISYDSGESPLTKAELIGVCDSARHNIEAEAIRLGQDYELYAGLDWSGGGTEGAAFTVLTIGGYVRDDNRFQIVFMKRYEGREAESDNMIADVIRILRACRIKYIGADFGGGFFPNKQLSNVFGPGKVFPIAYQGKQNAKLVYKKALHRIHAFRSLVMADIFQAIKAGKLAFFNWEQFGTPFADDMLSIRAEYNEKMFIQQYVKTPGVPDDSFHSVLYCFLISMLDHKRPDVLTPIRQNTEAARAAQAEEEAMSLIETMLASTEDGM